MLLLSYLFLCAALSPAFAAPASPKDVITTWSPDSLKPTLREILDFLDPYHTPSAKQAFISCLVLITISAFSTRHPSVIWSQKKTTLFQRFRMRFIAALSGLVSPDHFAIAAWQARVFEGGIAALYNKLFLKDGKIGHPIIYCDNIKYFSDDQSQRRTNGFTYMALLFVKEALSSGKMANQQELLDSRNSFG